MKLLKARYDLVLYFFFPFSLLVTGLYFTNFDQLTLAAAPNGLFSSLLLLLLVLPKSKLTLGRAQKMTTPKWLLTLFLSQFLVILLSFTFANLIGIDLSHQKSITFNFVLFSIINGLFPWGFMTLFAVTLGYFIYQKQKLGLVSSTFEPLYKNTYLDSIGVAVDSYMRLIPFFVLFITLSLLTLGCIFLLSQWIHLELANGLTFQVSLISCVLLLVVSNAASIKTIHQLASRKIPTVIILLTLVLILSVLFVLVNVIGNFLIRLNPLLDVSISAGNPELRVTHVVLLTTFFSYALSAINAAYIAYISQGRTIRAVVFFSGIGFLLSLGVTSWLANLLQDRVMLTYGIILVAGIFLTSILVNKSYMTYFFRATLPTDEPIKARSNFRFFKITPLAVVAFVSAYFGLNVYIWSYFFILGFLPSVTLIWISFVAFLVDMWRNPPAR